AVIGSSTAAGEGASSSSRGWVSLLASALEDRVAGSFSSRNLSVGGYTTSNLVPGSSSSGSIDDALDLEPNLVIVALAGSNDLSNGVSTETFLDRLGAIRDAGVDAGIPVFFVSTAPKDLSDDEQQALADWTDEMRDAFGSCWTPDDASYAPCFIDIFDALANSSLGIADEYGSGDGIHLNDAGHARIFEIAEAIVEPYVCSMTACR
ncbi:MAG TPA: SGNH/GDSL hydrolase family protein, partial [Polyangiaceae bacterium]